MSMVEGGSHERGGHSCGALAHVAVAANEFRVCVLVCVLVCVVNISIIERVTGFRAPRWRGAHSSASRPKHAKPWRHDSKPDLCRRSQKRRIRRTSSKRACAASSRDGVTASFLPGHRSEMCTGARGKNGNKPFCPVAKPEA